ncbi:MAG: hypothetical protein JW718_09580 [Desulfovibrionaceae bacterium]|nr:hypothetical protein [Desulfovibrionaceae bacterium]
MNAPRVGLAWLGVLALAVSSALCGCGPKSLTGPDFSGPAQAWQWFRQAYCRPAPRASGILTEASFYYFKGNKTNRTTLRFWGDLDLPLRLDVSAGVGTSLAFFREDADGLLAYYPDKGQAFSHADPIKAARCLSLPLSFSLKDLAALLSGDLAGFAPESFDRAGPAPGKGYAFGFRTGRVRELTLDRLGRPATLRGEGNGGPGASGPWELTFSYPLDASSARVLADRLTLVMAEGAKGVLRIKGREFKARPWPASSLALRLPQGTNLRLLDDQAAGGGGFEPGEARP